MPLASDPVPPGAVAVPLHGKHGATFCAWVDEADAPAALSRRWTMQVRVSRHRVYRYATTRHNGSQLGMHRFLTDAPKGMWVDHIGQHGDDHDGLDNRRSNLRICTPSENLANRRLPANSTTGYKGVARHRGRFCAQITNRGEQHWLGTFATAEEAARAYNAAARRLHGEFARLNEVPAAPVTALPTGARRAA